MKKIIYIYVILLLSACSATILTPAQGDADRGAQKFPGLTLAELNQGKTLYEASCGKCHGLKKPNALDEAGWRKIVPPMAQKAKIDAEAERLVLQYVVTMSEATRK